MSRWTSEQILGALRQVGEEHGFLSTTAWRRECLSPNVITVTKRFGNWRAAWETVGYPGPKRKPRSYSSRWDTPALLTVLRTAGYCTIDRWTREKRSPCPGTIMAHFGGWSAAWSAALGTDYKTSRFRARIIAALREAGAYRTMRVWHQEDRSPGALCIAKYFGGWHAAWKAAGVSPHSFFLPERDPRWILLSRTERDILLRLQRGQNQSDIAQEFRVSRQYVSQVKLRALQRLSMNQEKGMPKW